jgi:hypothetical protein
LLKGDEHYVIVKLITGEQLMAILEYESDNSVELVYPMLIRLFPILNGEKSHEHVTATPYSQFAQTAHITINKRHIVFLENLHHMLIPHFTRLVEENENKVLVSRQSDGSVKRAEDLDWSEEEMEEEAESLTTEELQKRIAMLESIFGKEEVTEEQEEVKNFVDGNNTLH